MQQRSTAELNREFRGGTGRRKKQALRKHFLLPKLIFRQSTSPAELCFRQFCTLKHQDLPAGNELMSISRLPATVQEQETPGMDKPRAPHSAHR